MLSYKEFLDENTLNEGDIWKKVRKWLINNVGIIKNKYIDYSSAYATRRIIVNNPNTDIKLLKAKDGLVYMSAIDKQGKERLLMTDDARMEDYEDMITGQFPIKLQCADMEEFKQNDIRPFYIYRVYEI
jgi:hypothetical protein